MQIYHYNEHTAELLGVGMADPDPLVLDNWLIPAHATTIEPPTELEGFTRHFIDGAWQYREIPPPPPPAPLELEPPQLTTTNQPTAPEGTP